MSPRVRRADAGNNRECCGRPLNVLITAVFRSVIRSRRRFNGALGSNTCTKLTATASERFGIVLKLRAQLFEGGDYRNTPNRRPGSNAGVTSRHGG